MPRRTFLLPLVLGLTSCAKPYLGPFHAEERIDIAHCGEIDRAEIKRFLDTVDWKERAWRERSYFLHRADLEKQTLRVAHVMEDSAIALSMDVRMDPEHYWNAGYAFESIVQDVQDHASDCALRVFAQSLPASAAEFPAPIQDAAWDSLSRAAKKDLWYAEVSSASPTPYTSRSFYGLSGTWGLPDVIGFENHFRDNPEARLAILFETRPVMHSVYHILVVREIAGGYRAAYSRFQDGAFLWKSDLAFDSTQMRDLTREIDFLEKANTYLLGRPDYVDPWVQTRCQVDLGLEKARSDSAVLAIREKCLGLSRSGVLLDKGRRHPIYLYRYGNLLEDRDRRNLDDISRKVVRQILRTMPAGATTWTD